MQLPEKTCLFISESHPGCFFNDLNSQKIRLTIDYCMGDFCSCPLYPRLMTNRAENSSEPSSCPE